MVILARDVSVDALTFLDPVAGPTSTVIPIVFDSGESLLVQTPQLVSRLGMSDDGIIELSLDSPKSNVRSFVSMLTAIAERAATYGDFRVAPTLTLAVPRKCPVYDHAGTVAPISDLKTSGVQVTAILKCLGLWAVAGKVGLSWKVMSLRVDPPAAPFLLKDDDEDEVDEVLVEMT